MHTARIDSALRNRRRGDQSPRHQLPMCASTGLARYRDRHQARQGVRVASSGASDIEVRAFACPDCSGFHLDAQPRRAPIDTTTAAGPRVRIPGSVGARDKRYFLVDYENLTHGARTTSTRGAALWSILEQQAPGVRAHDHVVVGAARRVVRRHRAAIDRPNVKWVVGADAPDGADRALLAAIDLRRVARDYDELVIASGDGAFVDLARRAKALGLRVHVITTEHPDHRSMLSRELSALADVHTRVRLRARSEDIARPLAAVAA